MNSMDFLTQRTPHPRLAPLPWTYALAVALSLMALSGCGNSDSITEPATPVAHRGATRIDAPLCDDDIRTFLEIVHDLPGGKAPQFEPLSSASVDDRLPAETLVNVYRREYRRMFDPDEQGSRWRRDAQLMQTLSSRGIEPEEFAALMTRMGCAVAAGTVSSRFNLTDSATKADQQLQEIIQRIDEWDSRAAAGTASQLSVTQRRQPLVDQLKDLVALSEFSRTLLSVPDESREVIARHQDELAAHLPHTGDLRLFERTLDAEAVIVPVSFEQIESVE